jgi:hypothetical protein
VYRVLRDEGKLILGSPIVDNTTVNSLYPAHYAWQVFMHPEYESILRRRVLANIKKDPIWYLDILFKRICHILNEVAPVALSIGFHRLDLPIHGVLLIPTLVLLVLMRQWHFIKLLFFTLPLATTALVIYAGGGATLYSIFPQVLAAIYFMALWSEVFFV